MRNLMKILFFLLATMLIVSCGGSGGAPAATSDWDEMKWDQDNWK